MLPQILALIALRAAPQIIERHLKVIKRNLLLAEAFFSEFPRLFEWLPPKAGSVAFPRCE